MSFLNGLGSLAGGLAEFGANTARDEPAAKAEPTPQAATAATQEPTPTPAASSPPAQPAAAATPASTGPGGVPANLLPIYAAASKRTGIPIDVLIAQGKQESGFRSDAVGSAGEIGLHQIKPSTAQQPGWGLRGIDPKTLRDPSVSINFAADYMRARAGLGVDFSDPAAVDAALARYNGGGDPNYVANVRRHMGAA